MRTRTFKLSENQIQALQVAYLHSKDGATRTRYQAVRLYGSGYAVAEILTICGCSLRRLLAWCQAYRSEGIAGLIDQRLGGNRARLLPLEIETLSELLHRTTPAQLLGADGSHGDGAHWRVADLAQVVLDKFGVRYQSVTSYRTLFARCDFSYQRATKQYKSHHAFKVMEFEEQLEKKSLTSPRASLTP